MPDPFGQVLAGGFGQTGQMISGNRRGMERPEYSLQVAGARFEDQGQAQ